MIIRGGIATVRPEEIDVVTKITYSNLTIRPWINPLMALHRGLIGDGTASPWSGRFDTTGQQMLRFARLNRSRRTVPTA